VEYILKYFPNLSARQREQFAALERLYTEWNARINVISRREMAGGEFLVRHVLHSLAIARVCDFPNGARILDIGTGGGFPAIPLAILFPEAHFTAVDSIAKKIRVVDEVAREVGLENLTPICGRVENIPERFDFAVSRAVAPAATLLGWVWPKIDRNKSGSRPGGVLLLKGGDLAVELSEAGRPYVEYPIAQWFDDPFFETKKVIHIEKR
jgi:16S rRNA (guanine527-N7)-methyltransferase